MKKLVKILMSLLLVFGLTGCVKYTTSMEVKKDKSVTLEIIYAMDTSAMEDLNFGELTEDEDYEDEDLDAANEIELTDYEEEEEDIASNDSSVNKEDYEWLEKKGYKVEEYTYEKDDSKYVGVKITKKYDSIDDISKDKDITVDFTTLFNDKDNFKEEFFSKKGNIYKANFVFDFTQDGEDVSDQYASYQGAFDLKYTIKLPNKAKKHNASKVSDDGLTYTWNLKYGKKNKVEFEFGFGSSKTILLVVGAIAIVAIIAGVVLLKKKNTTPTTTEPTVQQ